MLSVTAHSPGLWKSSKSLEKELELPSADIYVIFGSKFDSLVQRKSRQKCVETKLYLEKQ